MMVSPLKVKKKKVSSVIVTLLERDPIIKDNPFLANEKYIIDLLKKYKILDENINPTWRLKHLRYFIENYLIDKEETIEVKPEEDGTAMKIEQEIEEGVPQDIINEELKEDIDKHEKKSKTPASEKPSTKGYRLKDTKKKDNINKEEKPSKEEKK